jgi:hypothetical protein
MGQVAHGVYVDDCEGIHPDVIDQYYGVHGTATERAPGETGAGHLPDEDVPTVEHGTMEMDEDDWQDLEDGITAAQASNFHHEPVAVPKHANPFADEHDMQLFQSALVKAHELNVVPSGYGLLPIEWDDDSYPTYEIIRTGRRGVKELRVALPDFIWRPRAESWGRALDILYHIIHLSDNS